jgi:hypothetical protein
MALLKRWNGSIWEIVGGPPIAESTVPDLSDYQGENISLTATQENEGLITLYVADQEGSISLRAPGVGSETEIYLSASHIGLLPGTGEGQLERVTIQGKVSITGDITFNPDVGPVLEAPNGTFYRIKVANDGTLSTEVVT